MGVAGLAAVLMVASACGSTSASSPTKRAAPPPATSSPRDVVHAYVAALNAHDRAALKAITDDDGTAATWLHDIRKITDLKITSVRNGNPKASGFPEHTKLKEVAVTFIASWRHKDPSVESGRMDWGYVLEKNKATGWTIVDQGT